jgi:hypothetical protein
MRESLNAPETKRQYPRLRVFLDFLNLKGSLEEQGGQFLSKAEPHNEYDRL